VLDARRRPSRLYFSHFATRTVDNTVDLYAAKPDIRPESRFLPTPPAFNAPARGVPVGISPSRLARKNLNGLATRWCKKFEDIFIRFDATHGRDRQTNGQTLHDDIGRAYASHRAAKTNRKLIRLSRSSSNRLSVVLMYRASVSALDCGSLLAETALHLRKRFLKPRACASCLVIFQSSNFLVRQFLVACAPVQYC